LPSSRPASSYIPTLDGWRALAILLVLFEHASYFTFRPVGWTQIGTHGVEVFFVLSGYLITGKLLEDGSLRKFYTRRAFRILPVLFSYLGVAALTGFVFHRIPVYGSEFAASASFVRNYFIYPGLRESGGGWFTAHLWSLSIEEQFYLLWPLLLIKIGKGNTRGRFFSAVSFWAFWYFIFRLVQVGRRLQLGGWHWMPHLDYTGLVAGCILRIAFSHPPTAAVLQKVLRGRSTFVVLAVLAYIAISHAQVSKYAPWICAAAVCATLVEPNGLAGRILEVAALRWIGRLSYSLYVWQQLFLGFGVALRPFGILSVFPINLCALFVVACVSYYAMEKPLMRLGHQLTQEASARPAESALEAAA
jgi:peptidoglycan/LPS O-acetylase OafA/YrhL